MRRLSVQEDYLMKMRHLVCFLKFCGNTIWYGALAFICSSLTMFIKLQVSMEEVDTIGPRHDYGFPVWFRCWATGGTFCADFPPSRMAINYKVMPMKR